MMHRKKPLSFPFLRTVLLATVLFSACTSAKEAGIPESKHFKIIGASFEYLQSGRPGGENGTAYRFTAVINTADAIGFTNVWIREKGVTLPVTAGRMKGPATNQPFTFSKGDTIALYASVSSETELEKAAAPVDLQGEAIISYNIDGKKLYKAIPALTQKHTDPRPQ